MARYRKKPVVIEAIQYDGLNLEEIRRFVGSSLVYHIFDSAWKAGACQPVVDMKIKTLEGEMQVGKGDYIIKGVHGEFYPCKPDIFKETYELANIADVVPKSEVERVYYNLKAVLEERAETKQEIAREIFEEIERVIGEKYEDYVFDNMEIEGVEQDAIIAFVDSIQKHFAELKKKYTEGNT